MIFSQIDLPALAAGQGVKKRTVLREIGPTLAAEMALTIRYKRLLKGAAELVRKHAMPIFESAKQQLAVDGKTVVQDTVRELGAFATMFQNYINNNLPEYNRVVDNVIREEEVRFRSQLIVTVKSNTGIDISPVLRSTDVGPQIEAAVLEHTRLIKGVSDELAKRVATTIIREAGRGTRAKDLAKILANDFGFAQKRARLIARDQLGAFTGVMNKVRQQQIGIDKYVWSTSMDERVRPDHAKREGRVFSWENPPSDGHPGEPINCRCVAQAIIVP